MTTICRSREVTKSTKHHVGTEHDVQTIATEEEENIPESSLIEICALRQGAGTTIDVSMEGCGEANSPFPDDVCMGGMMGAKGNTVMELESWMLLPWPSVLFTVTSSETDANRGHCDSDAVTVSSDGTILICGWSRCAFVTTGVSISVDDCMVWFRSYHENPEFNADLWT